MEITNLPIWATVIIAVLTTIGGSFGTWLFSIYKQTKESKLANKSEDNKNDVEQAKTALEIYKSIVETLQKDRERMIIELKELGDKHNKCEGRAAVLEAKVQILESELAQLKIDFQEYKNSKEIH